MILLGGIHDVNTMEIWGGMGQSDGVYGELIAKNQGSVQVQLLDNTYGCLPKIGGVPPKSSIFNKVFPLFSPSILGGIPIFWEHPYQSTGLVGLLWSFEHSNAISGYIHATKISSTNINCCFF